MKLKLPLIIILLLLSSGTNAQIVLEHTYPGTSSISYPGNYQQLYIIKLEVDGEKYVHISRVNKILTFYNLNHTFWKTISYAAAMDLSPVYNGEGIMYLSQHLFDLDDDIEFLYCEQDGPANFVTQIVEENGTIIFTANNSFPYVLYYPPQVQLPIYNTAAGTKLILSCTDSSTQVYGLQGVLSSSIIPDPFESTDQLLVYPNPSSEKVILENENYLISKIIINDERGNVIRTIENMKVKSIEINVSSLTSGVYFIQIFDERGKLIETKKIVKQ